MLIAPLRPFKKAGNRINGSSNDGIMMTSPKQFSFKKKWAITIAAFFFIAGLWALRLQSLQARDIVRKNDIEDIEKSLVRYAKINGTFPPYEKSSWCGVLSDPKNSGIRAVIEESLRKDQKYAKSEKRFPQDPLFKNTAFDYLYQKTSPVSFELLARLEADKNRTRTAENCDNSLKYDYSVVSFLRNPF